MSFVRILIAVAVVTGPLSAHASTPAAWSSHQSEVVAKCTKASGLKDAQLVGSLVEYDDGVGYTAALVAGTYPQPHMKNKPGRSLCLFDKRNRTAHLSPADDIR